MLGIKVIIPLLALILQIVMKFVVGREVEKKSFPDLICELPTNFIFLSISLSLVYIFLHELITPLSVVIAFIFIIFSLIVVTIFRRCKNLSDAKRIKNQTLELVLLVFLNYAIALSCFYVISDQLIKEDIIIKEHQQPTKQEEPCK